MRELNRLGAQWVVVTQGPQAVWLSSSNQAYRFVPPRVAEVVNPIGCGDALAAGIAWATRQGDSIIDAVRFGIGTAGDNLRKLMPCRLDGESVANRAHEVEVAEVPSLAATAGPIHTNPKR